MKHLSQWMSIAWRNIARQRKRTILLAGAIGFAVLVITLVNSYSGGLVLAVRENFTQSLGGHIYVSGSYLTESGREVAVLRDTDTLDAAIERAELDVREINERSNAMATLVYTTNEVIQLVDGVDFAAERRFRETIRLAEGSWEELSREGSVLLPSSVADQLGIALGERLLLSVSTVTGQRNVIELTLRGITPEVAGLGITSAYINLRDLNLALGLAPGEYQSANIYLNDPGQIDAATERLERALRERGTLREETSEEGDLPGAPMALMRRLMGVGSSSADGESWEGTAYRVSNLNDSTAQLETVIDTLNVVAFAIFVVLLVITAVGITNSYRMVMIERTQEIGTMRSIGVKRTGIRAIFTLEALFVAVLGSVGGVTIALLVTFGVGLIEWGASTALAAFLVRGRLQADVSLTAIAGSIAIILIMTIWAVRSPAKAAAALEPAQALRATY